MPSLDYLFTSESVTEGHPDKIADQISDAILDEILRQDSKGRVACETMVTTGLAVIAGEITTSCYVDMPAVVRRTIEEIGYDDSRKGFDFRTCAVVTSIDKQSPDISQGVTEGQGLHVEQGAGDQGMMFGFACDETPVLMPAPIHYAHLLSAGLTKARKDGRAAFFRPDGKSQVTVQYENGKPRRIHTIVIATQHDDEATYDQIVEAVREEVVKKSLPAGLVDDQTIYHINATGRFVVGGPMGDCGLTGRKIIVDTYGGMGRHGGGAFSGKDPSKVDRSAAYMGRYIAKNVVAAGLASRVEIQLAYVIGVADPVSVYVDTFGTGTLPEEKIAGLIREVFPLKPAKIIAHLDLLKPRYKATAAYGHFGRTEDSFTWERTDKAAELKALAGK